MLPQHVPVSTKGTATVKKKISWNTGMRLVSGLIGSLLLLTAPLAAQAQNPYSAAYVVNEKAITYWDIEQRIKLLEALGARGGVRELAIEQLTNERLQIYAAELLDLELPEEAVEQGIEEFAQRRNLTGEQVKQGLLERGISEEAFHEFVYAGLIWREVVQARFRALAQPSEADLDAALDFAGRAVSESVNIQEIALPFEERGEEATRDLADRLSRDLNRGASFTAAVNRYSRSESARRGGNVGWVPAENLPPNVAGQVLALLPGEVTAPIELPAGVMIVKLLDIREEPRTNAENAELSVVYSQLIIPLSANAPEAAVNAAMEQAESIRRDVRFCADVDSKAEEFGIGSGRSEPTPANAVPADVAGLIANMDVGDTEIRRDSRGVVLVMLCSRSDEFSPEERETLRRRLFAERMTSFGNGYLQELLSDAVIEER
jgi:peptidyl-prolyl cis-trans isomerase SurA